MTAPSLPEFILARVAEDEAAARACVHPAHDGHRPHPELAEWFHAPGDEVMYVQTPEMLAHQYADPIYVTCDYEGLSPSVQDDIGDHIASHDPARVLRQCEAIRRMVTNAYECGAMVDGEWGDSHGADEIRAGKCSDHGAEVVVEHLTPVASIWSDHEDFRAEWAA